jgi:DNA-binding GntR family transcriptional regulator
VTMVMAPLLNKPITNGSSSRDRQRPLSLSQQAYQQIKRKIVTLDLPPGAVIDRHSLEEELGLGRTPMREALQQLAWESLVQIVPRRGIFVSDIGVSDPKWLFEVRLELDKLAARLAARRGTAEQWQRMEAILSDLPDEGDPHNQEILVAIDEACHEIIYEATDNEFLRDTLRTLYALSLRLWYYYLYEMGDMAEAIREHVAILDALRAGDEEEAAARIEDHLFSFQEELQSAMMELPVR